MIDCPGHLWRAWKRHAGKETRECAFCLHSEERPMRLIRAVNADGSTYEGPEYSFAEEKDYQDRLDEDPDGR